MRCKTEKSGTKHAKTKGQCLSTYLHHDVLRPSTHPVIPGHVPRSYCCGRRRRRRRRYETREPSSQDLLQRGKEEERVMAPGTSSVGRR